MKTQYKLSRDEVRALKRSIKHWEIMRAEPLNELHEPSPEDCSLCQEFRGPYPCYKIKGKKCPIFQKTKHNCCEGSPYQAAHDSWDYYKHIGQFIENPAARSEALLAWHKAAGKEIKFLKSLLPKE